MTNLIPKDERGIEPCLALYLRKANRVVTQIYDHTMSHHGIKITQFSILRAVSYLGETTNRNLQEVLVLDQTTLSRNLKPLLRDGYLQAREGSDRREKLIELTAAGKTLFKQARTDWQKCQQSVAQELGEDMTRQLLDLSDRVVEMKP